MHQGGPLLIVAGAGSGKTRVLTHRIAYLLAERRRQPRARSWPSRSPTRPRARWRPGPPRSPGSRARAMWVMTFHSACVRILRREATRFGYPSSFSIYDQADSQRLMALVCRELDLDTKHHPPKAHAHPGLQPEERAHRLRDVRRRGPTATGRRPWPRPTPSTSAGWSRPGAMDFDDLIMVTVNLLQAFPEVAETYRRAVPARPGGRVPGHQPRAVHAGPGAGRRTARWQSDGDDAGPLPPAELCVVGDADQSIYAFRGATIRNIEEFERDFTGATRDPAGAELPLHAEHPGRGQRGGVPQRRPDAQEPVVRRGRRAADRRLRGRQRARRGRVRGRGSGPARPTRARPPPARSPCSTGPTPSPGCSRKCSSGPACPTRWSAGSASTSAARSATCWPTCG